MLEGIFKCLLVQLPCNEQEHLQLDQVTQSLVQPVLECLQGLASTTAVSISFALFCVCVNHISVATVSVAL